MISARALDHLRQHFCGEAVRISDDNNTKAPPTSDGKEDNQKETVSRLIHKPVKDDNSSIAVNVENELLRLPAELQLMILQHLTFGEVESLRRTCRLLRHTINKPFIREVFPSIKFELLSTCYRCLRYDALRDHLIHADESDARYPLANECLDCVSSRGGFVVGPASLCWKYYKKEKLVLGPTVVNFLMACWVFCLKMGILGLWIPPLTGVVRTMEKRSEGVRAADIATIFFIACNILFRFINVLGNTLLVSEYKLWRRYMPNQSRPSRILNKVIAFLIFWTYPPSIEQKFPGKWWFSRQNTQAGGV
ncbi:hypothetical protein Forpi1262_v001691 [Fusarium oxysporum f. sp. raphani]|uniref:F-box domain-containing protein n=1 Tax=Fusarium oxysporum f. sp. raphani TaxID=96318 RepID=A0A8J5PVY1_FUSOX|nr:hypothetical protein Forpi1262_v001691 [Fusarium oxysporum f. sp. raphani]